MIFTFTKKKTKKILKNIYALEKKIDDRMQDVTEAMSDLSDVFNCFIDALEEPEKTKSPEAFVAKAERANDDTLDYKGVINEWLNGDDKK